MRSVQKSLILRCGIFYGLFLTISSVSFGHINQNSNEFSDVWEAAHKWDLDPADDPDLDSFSNAEESIAGTDPHDAESYPRSSIISKVSNDVLAVHFPTVPGVRYALEGTADFFTWFPVGQIIIGDGLQYKSAINVRETFVGGVFTRSVWTGLTGYGVALIKNYATNQNFPAHAILPISSLEIAQTSPNEEQFGQFIRGWIIPPVSGNYTFWIASDDSSELWISTNSLKTSKSLAASVSGWTDFRQWNKYASQQSTPRYLEKNQSYYMEIYQRESGGGDHLSVAWSRPDASPDSREIISVPHISSTGQSLNDLSTNNGLMFRLIADQMDSDEDGLTDYEEFLLGLNPDNPTSTPRQPDAQTARRTLDSDNSVTIGGTTPRAYEQESAAGQFTIYRAGSIEPITIPYTISGTASIGTDYAVLPGSITMPAGKRTAFIDVIPVLDDDVEPGETVIITLLPGSDYVLGSPSQGTVTIDDSMDVLYVAQLRPGAGITSSGFGIASVRRAGNSLGSQVSLSFSGLSSAQLAAELYISTDGHGGTNVLSLPLDQVAPMSWNFSPTNGITSENIVQALDDHRMWVRIRSTANPSFEIYGLLTTVAGWQDMPPPTSPPSAPSAPINAGEAARFLTQSTFGSAESDISNLLATTYTDWIEQQMSISATYHLPYVEFRRAELMARDGNDGWQSTRQEAWWQHALRAPDQLRQRMAWALSQIFVVSQFGALDSDHVGTTIYYDMLIEEAFGNYRDLLEKVTLSPMMGIYLSMMRNQKPNPITGHEPDENYAREVMQLLSIGLSQMHTDGSLKLDANGMPIPTYTQDDIVGLAHIFTGWSVHYDVNDPPTWSDGDIADPSDWFFWGWDALRPMTFYAEFHDSEDRTIVGNTLIAGSTNGVDRMRQALDALFNHPNVGPFIARQLIQRFVTSNPSPGYIHRVASVFNDNGSGVRGDLGATIKAVLLDYEARSTDVRQSISYGKPVEPVMRLTRMLRAFPPIPPFMANSDDRLFIHYQWSLPEQAPLLASSVFNFYQPGYRQPGTIARSGLLSPEFQIFAETTAIREANIHYSVINWGIWTPEPISTNENAVLELTTGPEVAILQTAGLTALQAQSLLIDHLDDRLLFGAMSPQLRSNIQTAFAALPGGFTYTDYYQDIRVRMALYLIYNSPEFLVQK